MNEPVGSWRLEPPACLTPIRQSIVAKGRLGWRNNGKRNRGDPVARDRGDLFSPKRRRARVQNDGVPVIPWNDECGPSCHCQPEKQIDSRARSEHAVDGTRGRGRVIIGNLSPFAVYCRKLALPGTPGSIHKHLGSHSADRPNESGEIFTTTCTTSTCTKIDEFFCDQGTKKFQFF